MLAGCARCVQGGVRVRGWLGLGGRGRFAGPGCAGQVRGPGEQGCVTGCGLAGVGGEGGEGGRSCVAYGRRGFAAGAWAGVWSRNARGLGGYGAGVQSQVMGGRG